jgi:hypothetical protein
MLALVDQLHAKHLDSPERVAGTPRWACLDRIRLRLTALDVVLRSSVFRHHKELADRPARPAGHVHETGDGLLEVQPQQIGKLRFRGQSVGGVTEGDMNGEVPALAGKADADDAWELAHLKLEVVKHICRRSTRAGNRHD